MQGVEQGMKPIEDLMAKGVPFTDQMKEDMTRALFLRETRRENAKNNLTGIRESVGKEMGYEEVSLGSIQEDLKKMGGRIYDFLERTFGGGGGPQIIG